MGAPYIYIYIYDISRLRVKKRKKERKTERRQKITKEKLMKETLRISKEASVISGYVGIDHSENRARRLCRNVGISALHYMSSDSTRVPS